jgi:hypothetical protein
MDNLNNLNSHQFPAEQPVQYPSRYARKMAENAYQPTDRELKKFDKQKAKRKAKVLKRAAKEGY